ncbi:hypothetical protein HHI36_002072 [Cryptolaemus montrouzieri]|uniref:Generative cell specific-1/HAP2 domain-containing protein n=1 Tax=Cryptolaemus montrouzieri TaxID=559131 RepID=A0ABD2P9C6_9CUCU
MSLVHCSIKVTTNIWFLLFPIISQFVDVSTIPCVQKVSNYEIRAVLVPCYPHHKHCRCDSAGAEKLQGFDGFVCEQGKMKNCIKKVVISLKLTNVGTTNRQPQYVIVDEVYDCQTDTNQKLLYPYVLKIKQEPLYQTYRLQYESCVRERCRAMESKKGKKKYKRPCISRRSTKIPWVQCDNHLTYTIQKLKRKAEEIDYDEDDDEGLWRRDKRYGDRRNLKGKQSNMFYYNHRNIDPRREKRILFRNSSKVLPFGVEGQKDILSSIEFPMKPFPSDSCDYFNNVISNKTPYGPTPSESCYQYCTLCNMRYYIYNVQEPVVKHHFSMEIFEKHKDINGFTQWNAITIGKPIYLGTYDTEVREKNESFIASYSSHEPPLRNFALSHDSIKLLIPQFPYLRGGAERFLVIPENMFIMKEDCFGSSGVHYGAREKYITECSSIKFPPKSFWCTDMELEKTGIRGNFFLKNFAKLPQTPLHNTTDSYQNLTFFYEGPHQSNINIEIKADFNIMLKPHASAVITEVYVDATNFEKTDLTVKVTNSGLVYAVFYVFLTDCPLDLPAGFSNIATASAVIPPQKQHVFAITVLFPLPKKKFHCSVDVKNYRHDVLAFRRIRFQRSDRCICIWHCCCTCLETDKGLKCHPLPIDHYNAAGFYGGLPMASKYIMSTSFVEEYVLLLFNLCLTMTILLLIMGIIKGLLGLFYPSIGRFGLEWYLGLPKSIVEYYESNLREIPMQYDKLGWPIHPDTKKRCRTTSLSTEFTINVVFFLLYPLILLHAIVIKICSPELTNEKSHSYKCQGNNESLKGYFVPPPPTKSFRKRCKRSRS